MSSMQESKLIKFPIGNYKEDIDNIFSEEKKQEILNLFTNSSNLLSEKEFNEIEDILHRVCRRGDLELIKILLSETIQNDSNEFTFKINKTNQTASLFKINNDIVHAIIPRSVEYESNEYLITSVIGINNFFIKSIKFAEDSVVEVIHEYSFLFSCIEEIYFPASLKELKEEWCCDTNYLTKIAISPLNGQFMFKDKKYLIGKSNPNNDEFDVLLFASRDIEEISIPPNIKIISSFAFSVCRNLTKVEIPTNSNLQIIESNAFASTKIEEIYFPASLKELKEEWCCNTENLTKIAISPLNGQFMFKDKKYLIGKSNPNNDEFDVLLFASRDVEEISIPPNIKIISSFAFSGCRKLKKVEIPTNSNLQIIESNAFENSKIKEIHIPSKVSKICESTFKNCSRLTKIEIPTNSNLQIIESNAFASTKIEEIYFPASLKELKEGWCCNTENLTKITISPLNGQFMFKDEKYLIGKSNLNNDEFDVLLFASRNIEEISIPLNIKIISSFAFSRCNNLTRVEIPTNSNLQIIESDAFSYSNIDEIYIPSKVSKICESTFEWCYKLTKVEIPTNSNLQIIESNAFANTKIEEIYFPANLKELKEGWCCNTENLTKIKISPLNDQFMFKDEKYLIGKSNPNNDEFDVLLFASRDIEEISIPPNIKIISSFAFSVCRKLTKIEIPTNSNLQIIESDAFSYSSIEEFFIPSKVSTICEVAFHSCQNLTKFIIPTDTNLQEIKSGALNCSNLEEFYIPSNITIISSFLFAYCHNFSKIEFAANSNAQIIEESAFRETYIKEISIPSTVSKICKFAFACCYDLKNVKIPMNSDLQTIEQYAFYKSNIEQFYITSKVSEIGQGAFKKCQNLLIVEVSEESKLDSFPLSAFIKCPNIIIMIPSSLNKLIHI